MNAVECWYHYFLDRQAYNNFAAYLFWAADWLNPYSLFVSAWLLPPQESIRVLCSYNRVLKEFSHNSSVKGTGEAFCTDSSLADSKSLEFRLRKAGSVRNWGIKNPLGSQIYVIKKSNFDDFGTDLDPFLLLDSECAQSEIDQSANQGIFPVVLVLELECQSWPKVGKGIEPPVLESN